MNITINRILELSGPMPDAEAHRRHLQTLSNAALMQRLKDLEDDQPKEHYEAFRFRRARAMTPILQGEHPLAASKNNL